MQTSALQLPSTDRPPAPRRLSVPAQLVITLVIGLFVRQWAYDHTGPIRFQLNQENAFYWGNRIVRGAGESAGPVPWGALWRSYVGIYEANEKQPAPAINTLDYVPLRLLMAGAWVNYLHAHFTDVTVWRPEFARSFAAFSMFMELASATAMFALVGSWLRRDPSRSQQRWQYAAAAAMLVWFNPAGIVDSHVWPHGQTWIIPFYLLAVLAMVSRRSFAAGMLLGIGAMFKGQMLMVAPVLVLWPVFDRRWGAAVRVLLGIVSGIVAITWPWLLHGSFAWARAGFASPGMYSDVLRKGEALNLPAILAKFGHLTLHQHLLHTRVELKTALMAIYAVLLVCCARGIARQARNGDRKFLVSIAAPWAVMFFVLGQMDERYLVWSACISAGSIAVGRKSVVAHALLTWAGAATMLEFLLICRPAVAPGMLHMLIVLNPVTWLVTAGAVGILMFYAMGRTQVSSGVEARSPDARPSLGRIETAGTIRRAA